MSDCGMGSGSRITKKPSGRTNPFARKRNATKKKDRKTATVRAACQQAGNCCRMEIDPTWELELSAW